MRFLVPALLMTLTFLGTAAHADPAQRTPTLRIDSEGPPQMWLGAALDWVPKRLGNRRVALGLAWTVPLRWYDVDGQLLTERSLLHPGDDLERSGLYFALRF